MNPEKCNTVNRLGIVTDHECYCVIGYFQIVFSVLAHFQNHIIAHLLVHHRNNLYLHVPFIFRNYILCTRISDAAKSTEIRRIISKYVVYIRNSRNMKYCTIFTVLFWFTMPNSNHFKDIQRFLSHFTYSLHLKYFELRMYLLYLN